MLKTGNKVRWNGNHQPDSVPIPSWLTTDMVGTITNINYANEYPVTVSFGKIACGEDVHIAMDTFFEPELKLA